MQFQEMNISREHVQKLLSAGNPAVTQLYIYLHCGNDLAGASKSLGICDASIQCAAATLRQLGLWTDKPEKNFIVGQRPSYSEADVTAAMSRDRDFFRLHGEIEQRLGKTLNTEELKILLSFHRYLGLPIEVISLLVSYCQGRARNKGSLRNPSLRTIEKEAYRWAELGIDTMEEASAYMSRQNLRQSKLGKLMELLQIRGRSLTAGEERYAQQWLDWGFAEDAIALAYERTCLNTGGLNWAYMNKILASWQKNGLLTADAVKTGDTKPKTKTGSFKAGQRQLDNDELAAINQMFQEV